MGRGFTSGEGTVCSGEGIPGWNGMRSVVGVCCRCPQHLGRVRAGGIQGEAAQAFGTQSCLAGCVLSDGQRPCQQHFHEPTFRPGKLREGKAWIDVF